MSDSNPNSGGIGIRFSERQNRIITASATCVLILGALISLQWMFGELFKFLGHHSTVLLPPVVGIVLAMIAKPIYNFMETLFRGRRMPAVAATTLVVFVPVVAFLWIGGAKLVEQGIKFLEAAPDLSCQAVTYLTEKIPAVKEFLERYKLDSALRSFDIGDLINQLFSVGASGAAEAAGKAINIGTRIVGSTVRLLSWIVLPVYTAFFLATRPLGGEDVRKLLVFTSPRIRDNAAFLVDQFLGIVVTFFRGQFVIVIVQGILYGIGFQFSGLSYGFFIGFVLGLLNIVPYLGNIIGLGVTLPLAMFGEGGSLVRLLCVLGVFIAVHTLDTYFITPRIMGSRTGLNSFVVIFSIFFWGSVIGGVLGMILAVPLSAFIVVFWRLLLRDYLGVRDSPAAPAENAPAETESP